MLSEIERMAIERACERVVLDWADRNDRQDYAALAALFVENGVMTRPNGHSLHGRKAILEAYQASPGRLTRHICTNIRVTVESADLAYGRTYAVVYSADANKPPETRVGEFDDEFVRTEEGWRFAVRRARFVMSITRQE